MNRLCPNYIRTTSNKKQRDRNNHRSSNCTGTISKKDEDVEQASAKRHRVNTANDLLGQRVKQNKFIVTTRPSTKTEDLLMDDN